MTKKIRVVVVDDSAFYRRTITEILNLSGQIEVVRGAYNGLDAIRAVSDSSPDVITLDLEMPEMDGFTFLRWLMNNRPIPTLIISSRSEASSVFRALELGAIDFIEKPSKAASLDIAKISHELISKVKTAASIPKEKLRVTLSNRSTMLHAKPIPPRHKRDFFKLVAIGASTGGPSAVQELIKGLPGDLPATIVISQHMPPGFTRYFSERLNRLGMLPVKEASDGERIEEGMVYISPGGKHLTLRKGNDRNDVKVLLHQVKEGDKYSPSVDLLMSSAAEVSGPNTIGVLLTGMGSDGKRGLRKIKESGGRTIAESESTAIVFGMPREAIQDGVVDKILPLNEIAGEIAERCWSP